MKRQIPFLLKLWLLIEKMSDGKVEEENNTGYVPSPSIQDSTERISEKADSEQNWSL